MAIVLDGTNGITNVDGSAAAPAFKNQDANTGLSGSADQIVISTGGSERLRVSSAGQLGIAGANYGTDGHVLTSTGASSAPAWEAVAAGASGPCFYGYHDSGELQIPANTWTKVHVDEQGIGDTGMWSEANSRFTPTTAGTYFIHFEATLSTGNSDLEMQYQFRKNGNGGHSHLTTGAADIFMSPFGGSSHPTHAMSNASLMAFNGSSDYVECWAYHNGGGERQMDRPRFVAFKVDS